jgi:hypothetical protein
VLAQPETNETTIDMITSGIARRIAIVAALGALVVLLGAGCSTPPERRVRAVSLVVETVPPSAKIACSADGGETRELGPAPLSIEGFKVVRKVYSSGAVDYWLSDDAQRLPPAGRKPEFASADYVAGNDYPLDLRIVATSPGYDARVQSLRIDRATLERLFEKDPTLGVSIVLEPARARPSEDGPAASASYKVPRD